MVVNVIRIFQVKRRQDDNLVAGFKIAFKMMFSAPPPDVITTCRSKGYPFFVKAFATTLVPVCPANGESIDAILPGIIYGLLEF